MRRVAEPVRPSEPSRSAAPARRAASRRPGTTPAEDVLELQRLLGNARTTQVLARRAAARPATRMLQRLFSADDLQAFRDPDYHTLLERIRRS